MTETMRSFVKGLAAGLVGGGNMPHIEPVAYLYGDGQVRLPVLPAWDRKEYPYAVIVNSQRIMPDIYFLHFSKKLYVNQYDWLVRHNYVTYQLDVSEGPWEWSFEGDHPTAYGYMDKAECVWVSENIYDDSGNLYATGGEPMPVYE